MIALFVGFILATGLFLLFVRYNGSKQAEEGKEGESLMPLFGHTY